MKELKPRIHENGIDYILVGDYYLLYCFFCRITSQQSFWKATTQQSNRVDMDLHLSSGAQLTEKDPITP